MKKLFSLLVVIIFVSACNFPAGAQEKETRNVDEFHSVSLSIAGTVYIKQGDRQKLVLEADEDDLEDIETDVRNGRLIIRHEGSSRWFRTSSRKDVTIYITMEDVEGLSVSSSGHIYGESTLKGDDMTFSVSGSGKIDVEIDANDITGRISGSGKIEIAGSADESSYSISGSGKILAGDLKSNKAKAKISGSGSMEVYAVDLVDASISGSGSVYYRGEPDKVYSHSSGSGKVKKM